MRKTDFFAGMATMMLIILMVSTASAKSGKVTQEVQYNNIGIILDGTRLVLKDSEGNSVEPFMYNNTNYLPVRTIAEALGLNVAWDSNENVIILTSSSYNLPNSDSTTPISKVSATVVRVVDGDTIVVNLNGKEETVRLIGVDSPESVHPTASKNTEAGFAASEFTNVYLSEETVELEFDVQERDKYGRLLAYVYLDGEMFNEKLLKVGLASVATYPPNVKYVDRFTEIMKNRDSSIPSNEYLDGYMKAPSITYTTSAEINNMDGTFLYAEGVIKEFNEIKTESGSPMKYFTLTTTDGNVKLVYDYGEFQIHPDNLKIGDSVKIGFLYVGKPNANDNAFGVYMEILEKKNSSTGTNQNFDNSSNSTSDLSNTNNSSSQSNNRTVYITKTGKKYHYNSSCNGGTYYASTLQEAKSRGLSPCSKCA